MHDVILLALGNDQDKHVLWLRSLLGDIPVMTSNKVEGIKNLLPLATHVFIRPSTYSWKTRMGLPDHPQVFMIGTTDEATNAEHLLRNFREANLKDTFIVDDVESADRLKARFSA